MISKIFHISDIHILYKNYENIKFSFAQMLDKIINIPNYKNETVLVIAGDIFDTKTHITTDDIELFNKLIGNLDKFKINTIIIPGNHDYNINSKCKMDNVSVLLEKTNYSNIHCYSKTGVYEHWGINFHIFSPIDKEIPIINNNRFKVAVLHETVKSATFDNGIVVEESRFNPEYLSTTFDIAILGDIHKPQFLKYNVGYSGSFVQKTKGENLDHGYIEWDVKTRKGKHVFLKLKEVYLNINAINNETELLPNVNPRYIQIKHSKCTEDWLKKLISKIKSKYKKSINSIINNEDLCYEEKDLENPSIKSIELKKDAEVIKKSINNNLNQIELISNKLKSLNKSDDFIKNVIDYHKEHVIKKRSTTYTKWSLDFLAWNNMFCYGKDNYIDFSNLHGLVSILGENKIGKSTIIDILFLILFNKTYRGNISEIINKKSKNGSLKCGFSINGDHYIIEQWIEGSRKMKKHRLYKNGENITKSDIDMTYKFIADDLGIGHSTEFIKTVVALQNRIFLIDLPRKDRYEHFCKQLEIDMFDDIEKSCRAEKRLLDKKIKDIENDFDFSIDIKKCQIEINTTKDELKNIDNKIKNIKLFLKEQRNKKEEQLKFYNPDRTVDELKLEFETLQKLLASLDKNVLEKNINRKKNLEIIKDTKNILKNLEKEKNILEGKLSEIEISTNTTKKLHELENELKELGKEKECKSTLNELEIEKDKIKNTLNGKTFTEDIISLEINLRVAQERVKKIKVDAAKLHLETVNKLLLEKSSLEKEKDIDISALYKGIIEIDEDINDMREILNGSNFSQFTDKKINREIKKLQNNYSFDGFTFNKDCKNCDINKAFKKKYGDWEKNKIFIEKLEAWKIYKILEKNIEITKKIKEAKQKNLQKKNRIKEILDKVLGNEKYKLQEDIELYEKKIFYQRQWNRLCEINDMIEILHNNKILRRKRNELEKAINFLKNKKFLKNLLLIKKSISINSEKLEKLEKLENILVARERFLNIKNIIAANKLILKLNPIIDDAEKKYDTYNLQKTEFLVKIKDIENKISNKEKAIKLINESIHQLDIIKYYLKCIDKKKGIPSLVLGSACNILNKKCNEILNPISDFNVSFTYSSVKGIDISTTKTIDNVQYSISAEMASGFQKFILDIIIRVIFAQITKCSTPEILFIDEGFGCLDKNNFSNVCNTLEYFSKHFKSIFIISHIEEIQSYMDSNIKIKLNRDLTSYIQIGRVDNTIQVIEETLNDRKKANDIQKKAKQERKLKIQEEKLKKFNLQKAESEKIGLDCFIKKEDDMWCKFCKRFLVDKRGVLLRHTRTDSHIKKIIV